MHLFYNTKGAPVPFNALMNLARLFSPTKKALLLPFQFLEGITLIQKSLEITAESDSITLFTSLPGNQVNNNGVFSSYDAVLMDRGHPLWCPERFVGWWTVQWTQCLWYLWLGSLDKVHIIEYAFDAESTQDTGYDAAHVLVRMVLGGWSFANILQNRIDSQMKVRYRSETCIHLGRSIQSRGKSSGDLASDLGVMKERLSETCPKVS